MVLESLEQELRLEDSNRQCPLRRSWIGPIEAGGSAFQTGPPSMEDPHDEPPRRFWRGWINAKALAHQHSQGPLPRMSWRGRVAVSTVAR